MSVHRLDHVALPVCDLDASIRFYEQVIGLPRIDRPNFSFPGAWFAIGDRQLHLIARHGDSEAREDGSRGNHFAIAVDDLDQYVQRAEQAGLPVRGPGRRPDGVRQLFLQDPDGHTVELCDPPAT